MSTIDIRQTQVEVDQIRFADMNGNDYVADIFKKRLASGITVSDSQSGRYLVINDREHAQNMIAALQKAIEMEWV